jgi:photosystem II stability/assembly factor-like uncharacterized protein
VNFQEPVTANFYSDNATPRFDSFSSAVSAGDINLDNATGTITSEMGPYPSDNKTNWRGIFTPTDDTEVDNNTITLAASWTDQVGNPGTSVTTSNFKVDTKSPTVSSFTFSATDYTSFFNSDNIRFPGLKPGDNATLTLVFSEVVTNFSSDDNITAENVSLATMISTDNNITWTGIFRPTDNISEFNNTITLASGYTDIAGNTGTGTSAKWSFDNLTSNYVIDTAAPAVSAVSPADNNVCIPITDNITVTFDFPMDTNSITSDTSTGCGASIQVSSSDDSGVFFENSYCVRFPGNPVASDNNTTFTLDPVDNLSYDTTYKIKVTGGADADPDKAVKSALGNILSNPYESSFTTSPSPSSSVSGLFMAVGDSGNIVRSTDNGSSWDNATSCQFSTNLDDVTFGNNTFVAVGASGNIVRSTDNGSSFDNVTSVNSQYLYGITFGNNTFVAVGTSENIVRSTGNGSNWDNATSGISQYLRGITFGNNTFVAVGTSGKIVRSTDNGTSWDNATFPTANTLYGVTIGNNTFVGVGNSGNIVRSTDNASSWDNATSPTANTLNGVTFGNNTFVGVGNSGNIVRSTDNGSSWDNATSPTANTLYGVVFGNNTFVGVGASGNIVRSTDNGSSFDNVTSPIETNLKGVTFSE